MIRVTIIDTKQTVSFLTRRETAHRLAAGCSANPANLGELLIATDIYERGIAGKVMGGLIEFDKAILQKGPDFVHEAISQSEAEGKPLEMTFQVIDEDTEREARQARECELVIFDLAKRTIQTSQALEISSSGEVQVNSGEGGTNPTVTYILPQEWVIKEWDADERGFRG
ncbi:MAG: hypothetical protein P8Y14_29045 [Anaerolineales bacterium]